MLRHGASVGADLPPDAAVVLDPAGPELRPALGAAATGDHRPARDLLAATRLGAEWERRGAFVPRLARSALHSPGWLDAWLAEDPQDPDALLVKAELCVAQAWEIRTGARAGEVSRDQFQAFFALLDDAIPVIGAAAEANPADPVPWQIALAHATGSQAPREVFDAYWAEAAARAPHHSGCHRAALQYLSAKWHGSHEEMFDFAERAAEHALPGSQLHALPLLAAVEYDAVAAERPAGPAGVPRTRIDAALTRALELSASYGPGDPEAAAVRNHLALMLVLAGRHEEALGQFRAVGTHATELPWAYLGEARQEFLDFRTGARMHVASRTRFFSAPRVPDGPPPAAAPAPTSLAVVKAPPHRVAEAALLCGVPLRIAPAAEGTMSYVELAANPAPGRRARLLGEEGLTAAADSFTTGERWPALVLHRTADRHGFTLLHRGRTVAAHEWSEAGPVPDRATAATTAAALAQVYGLADPRPLTSLLRGASAPEDRHRTLLDLLGLPALPPAFGTRAEPLAALPEAQVLAHRGLWKGVAETLVPAPLRTSPSPHPSAPVYPPPSIPRPRAWWALRLLTLALFAPTAVYTWWSPDIGVVRAVLSSVATLWLTARLARAWHQRRRR